MKRWKQWSSALLAALMLAALMAVPAGATGTATGSITITDANEGMVYSIYMILELENYNSDLGAYNYKATNAWRTFFERSDIKDEYVAIDEVTGYITWKKMKNNVGGQVLPDGVEEFSKLALAYARTQTADGSKKADSETVSFTGLENGYYLVDSSVGVLCMLNTVAGTDEVEMAEKSTIPKVEKKVQENGTYGPTNDAAIGDTVNFQTTITAGKGAENYVLHDKMSDGLTFGSIVSVTRKSSTGANSELVADTDYTLENSPGDSCTFHVAFTKDFCDSLENGDVITISYTATLNENAVVAGAVNENETWLDFGNNSKTEHSKTTTNTWEFSVFKYAGSNKPLENATFTLSENKDGSDPIQLVASTTDSGYRVAMTGETGVTEIKTNTTGKFIIQGLDSGTYYLTETKAPDGYYKLDGSIPVTIDNTGVVTTVAGTNAKLEEETVKIENKPVGPLPSTGGVGTTVFYVLGSVLVVGAVVLFITKKRMSLEEK